MDELDKKAEEIKARIQCTKNFICTTQSKEKLCKARDVGFQNFLECLEEDPSECPFSIRFGYGHFCKCPLRRHFAKVLEK